MSSSETKKISKILLTEWKVPLGLFGLWTLLGLIFAGISYLAAISENEEVNLVTIFSTNLIRFYVWAALSPLIYLIAKRLDLTGQGSMLRAVLTHLPLSFVFSILSSIFYTIIVWTIFDSYHARFGSITNFFQQYAFFGSTYLGMLLYILIAIASHAWLIFLSYRAQESRNLKLQTQLAESELQALKMQLQPHFLFNTLHSISSLNLTDPQKANLMIARLGDFLRMTLDRSGKQMVNLEEELAFLRCYLEIEQIRFSDRLKIEFDVADETLAAEVPHLILQPVVENSVKHGIAPHSAGGVIRISSQLINNLLVLKVMDNGAGINGNSENREGTGLKNIRSRLTQIYEKDFSFELKNGNGMTAILEIPFSPQSDALPPDKKLDGKVKVKR